MEQKQVNLNQVYEKLLILERSMKKMDRYIEDLEFARRTEEAYERHEKGDFVKMSEKDFLNEIEKW